MQPLPGLIVILGAPNDEHGKLSPIAVGRAERGYREYTRLRTAGWKFLLTGGFGAHFNTTAQPHAYYVRQHLLALGVPAVDIIGWAESRNTIEDGLFSRPLVARYGVNNLLIVTSDFHLGRVRFVFEHVFPTTTLTFALVDYLASCPEEEQRRIVAHETHGLQRLQTIFSH
jgi:uncharacterized SAM-binding protein YcdF (DUF218 family)